MTDSHKTKIIVALAILLVAATVFAVYTGLRHGMLVVRTALAQEQMVIFKEMRDKALKAGPNEAVGYLEYAVGYYPSGTKQIPGSALDLMVEQSRSEMIRQMIADLREKTQRDLGNSPERWIAEYGGD